MISVVMPVYNGERYLKESIDSILEQTYSDFELIIVDDASDDNTPRIIQEYAEKDKRVKIVINEKNMKLPKSLNRGFDYCKGSYFTWTSDDNIYYKNAFEVMLKTLEEDDTVDFVFAQEEYIDADGKKIGKQKKPDDLDELYCRSIMSACFLYKREIHEKLKGYDETKFLIEDYDFFRRAYQRFKFKYIPNVLYAYRRHAGSLSETRMIEVRQRKIALLEESLETDLSDKIRNKIYRELADSYYEISDLYKDKLMKVKSKECKEMQRLRITAILKSLLEWIRMK